MNIQVMKVLLGRVSVAQIVSLLIIGVSGLLSAQEISSKEIVVKRIEFKLENESEKVFVVFNRFYIPEVETLDGDSPRLFVDIQPMMSWDGQSEIAVSGKLVKQIRAHFYPEMKRLRIVLDLDPTVDCDVNPTYFQAENMYSLEIREAKSEPPEVPLFLGPEILQDEQNP